MGITLFGKPINSPSTQEIDSFIFGTKKDNTTLGKYTAPAITAADQLETLEATSPATIQTDFDAVLISDIATDVDVSDQLVESPADIARGGAFEKMETAVIGTGSKSRIDIKGARSFINPLAIIHHADCMTANDFLDDETNGNGAYRKNVTSSGITQERRELTIDGLLRDFSDKAGPDSGIYSTPYRLGDFIFCKYFDRIPLNHMITLRRFAHPTYDNLTWGKYNNDVGTTTPATSNNNLTTKSKSKKTAKTPTKPINADALNKTSSYNNGMYNYKPIAQAVTFFGDPTGNDLEKITAIKGEIKWKTLEADVNKYEQDSSTGARSAEQSPFAGNKAVLLAAKGASILNGQGDLGRNKQVNDGNQINLFEAHWANKTYGPVDSITTTQIRDRGVHATYKIDLVFEFELRSYAGINPRIAMLDIIANMLALTFNNAKFWGGANIFFPNHPQFAFLGDQKALYDGDYGKYLNSVFSSLGSAAGTGLDILKSIGSAIMNLDFKGAIQAIANNLGGTIGGLVAAKSRPASMAVKSLITGQPVGCWHLTVGNPYRPILKMGNLIVKEWQMNFSGFMGVDDFPSEVKYTVTLETSRPVDKGGVESWINGIMESRSDGQGSGRLYYASKEMKDGVGERTMKDSKFVGPTLPTEFSITSATKSQTSDSKDLADAVKQIDQASGSLF